MIRQAELRAFLAERAELEKRKAEPAVASYLAATEAVKERLDQLRSRREAGEAVQPGRLTLLVEKSVTTAWEKVLKALHSLPGVAAALAADREAQRLLVVIGRREIHPPYVTERLKRCDVVSASG